jgi:hypothetical protein
VFPNVIDCTVPPSPIHVKVLNPICVCVCVCVVLGIELKEIQVFLIKMVFILTYNGFFMVGVRFELGALCLQSRHFALEPHLQSILLWLFWR